MPEEKTAISELPIQTIVPNQEQLFFPTANPTQEAQTHYSKLREGIGVPPTTIEPTEPPSVKESEQQVNGLLRFLRHVVTTDEAEQHALLEKMKGMDDIQLLDLSNEITHGLDIDAQVYQQQAQTKADERLAQVTLATEATKSPSKWSSIFSRFRSKAA